MKKHLIVYVKRPIPNYAKTRLGSKLGFDEAAGVYARLLYMTIFELNKLKRDDLVIEISTASEEDIPFFSKAFPEFRISNQSGSDLGIRLSNSIMSAFKNNAEAVIVIGTDLPDLKADLINEAFLKLETNDVVIGPATDGGYYLIGTRRKDIKLFHGIDWSSARVLKQTRELINSQNLSVEYLTQYSDLDTIEDYLVWQAGKLNK